MNKKLVMTGVLFCFVHNCVAENVDFYATKILEDQKKTQIVMHFVNCTFNIKRVQLAEDSEGFTEMICDEEGFPIVRTGGEKGLERKPSKAQSFREEKKLKIDIEACNASEGTGDTPPAPTAAAAAGSTFADVAGVGNGSEQK